MPLLKIPLLGNVIEGESITHPAWLSQRLTIEDYTSCNGHLKDAHHKAVSPHATIEHLRFNGFVPSPGHFTHRLMRRFGQ